MNDRKNIFSIFVVLTLLVSAAFAGGVAAVTPANAVKVARVTGATPAGETLPNPNQTHTNYQVYATDLGIMWDKGNGEIFVMFGDTYGQGWGGSGAGPRGADWRSNVLAKSTDTNLSDGLTFSTMIQDTPGHAKELLASKKINFDEETVIPTAGVTVGSRHYVHYMSVHHWGAAGTWFTNYAGIAYSDDDGQNWTKHPTARWTNDGSWSNKFQQAAFIKNGGYVYMYATPNGRFGDVYLARVQEHALLNKGDYRYWDGNGWSASESEARPVMVGAAGEISVVYNSHFKRYMITYLNEDRQAIVMRDAPTLVGPWSGEKVLASGSAYPGLYGAFIHPLSNNGTDLYFVMSQWDPYNSFLMKATLSNDSFGGNLVSEPGFETQAATPVMAPWSVEGSGGIDRNLGNARSGQDNGYVRSSSGWNALKQRVAVQPHTNYTLKGWVRTSFNNNDGYFGARVPNGGAVLGETRYYAHSNYTELTVPFNSGPNAYVELFAGMWANNGDTWVQLDDVSLTRDANLVGHAGFEPQPSSAVSSPWYLQGGGGIDRNLGFARTGANNAYVRNTSGWNAVKQEIFVEPNTSYTLTGWVRTSANNSDGFFGARLPNGGPILNEVPFDAFGNYTQLSVTFNSGSNGSVEIFAGIWAHNADTWMQMDDFRLTKQ
ncbi:DUF4185 domain-containing protein [Paenibacillus sp.]|uniref:DUF4185 domain-containing protein n=1 Tax=Paenibacillus sp. TaxID=58172 RepID=UPI002D75940C|nr:DUF4185 domain-containing protein [Paenibacillus sp.]HZG58802.1 DUF4185 domain-containing protein [Paenibacillus sp.]